MVHLVVEAGQPRSLRQGKRLGEIDVVASTWAVRDNCEAAPDQDVTWDCRAELIRGRDDGRLGKPLAWF